MQQSTTMLGLCIWIPAPSGCDVSMHCCGYHVYGIWVLAPCVVHVPNPWVSPCTVQVLICNLAQLLPAPFLWLLPTQLDHDNEDPGSGSGSGSAGGSRHSNKDPSGSGHRGPEQELSQHSNISSQHGAVPMTMPLLEPSTGGHPDHDSEIGGRGNHFKRG